MTIARAYANFSATAICLILRSCGSGVVGVEYPASHIAAHHANFSASANLWSTIDFAVLRLRSWRRGAEWNAAYHIAAHTQLFERVQLPRCNWFCGVRMRSWGHGAECYTFFGMAGCAPNSNF